MPIYLTAEPSQCLSVYVSFYLLQTRWPVSVLFFMDRAHVCAVNIGHFPSSTPLQY